MNRERTSGRTLLPRRRIDRNPAARQRSPTLSFVLALALAQIAFPRIALGEGQGDSVAVVYNSKLPESRTLAEYYASRRKVPTNQIFGLDLPTGESISRQEFDIRLRLPLLEKLEKAKLMRVPAGASNGSRKIDPNARRPTGIESRIRYAVLCSGVPLRIEEDYKLKEEGTEKIPAQIRKNEASVDSELALLPLCKSTLTLYGPFPNPSFATTNSASLHPTNGVLMVARLDGPSLAVARGLIDKAIQAESEGLWGRAYFDARGLTNGNIKIGDDWIKGAAEVARRSGFETVLDTKEERFPASFPMSQVAFYAGWYEYDGQVSGPFTRPGVEFLPGAFAYHLHSFSAATIRSAKQHWVGPLLDKGVTATMGCVYEPFLEFTPNLAVFFHRWVALGFSFGEAAYAGQNYLSWQTTVVGDPLYRPFGRSPRQIHEDLLLSKSKALEWWHMKAVNFNLVAETPAEELIQYLEEVPETRTSAVLLEKLGDLYLLKGRMGEAIGAYQKALPLVSSAPQKTRLLLELGRTFELSGAPDEAIGVYRKFIREFPEYPDLLGIYRKLLPLADRLKRAEEKELYQKEIERLTSIVPSRS
ncbi:MAG: TIGR03790 family protein [Verrucomicrobia bacterium]|nr:TIGR03790 family protein [Verrucomicrobiota bacterium]